MLAGLVACFSWPALGAGTLELLGPPGDAPPDGFPLALRRVVDGASAPLQRPEVTAEGAEVFRGPPSEPLATYLIAPRPGVRKVIVQARDGGLRASATFSIGPPAARVELTLTPSAPVKNRDSSAELHVRMLRPDGAVDAFSAPPVLRANVGSIEALEQVRPGEYRARYVLPQTLHPEVAVIIALSAWPHPQSIHGVFGGLRVPLATAIELPGQTERDAQMTVEIAGVKFGPVKAAGDGRFRIPVIVPPGYGAATGTAVDTAGNRRTGRIDLRLPPTDQLACVMNPARLPADGTSRARVLCATSDPYGKVVSAAKVALSARHGKLSAPRHLEDGIIEWIYTAPRVLLAQPDVLTASWRQGRRTSREELSVGLVQGPAARVKLSVADALVHYGGQLGFELHVTDVFDRPRVGARVELRASLGDFTPVQETEGGRFTAVWKPPASGEAASAEISARAFGPLGTDPARIAAWSEAGGLFVAVTDLAGLPVPEQPLLVGERQVVTGGDGTLRVGDLVDGRLEVRHRRWPGLRNAVHVLDGGRTVFPAAERPGSAPAIARVELAPPVPVNVRVQVAGREVTYWVESSAGEPLAGRDVRVQLSHGTLGPTRAAGARYQVTVSTDRPATLSVADVLTGVTALAEVRP